MKYRWLWSLIFFQFCFGGAIEQIQRDREDGRITAVQALYYEALTVYAPEELPSEYRTASIEPVKCGFEMRSRLQQAWPQLSEAQRSVLEPLLARPELPLETLSPSGRFRLHYTTEGNDAVPTEDLNANDIPDFIEEGGKSLDLAYEVQIVRMGFHEPPQDSYDGPEWDVYFRDDNNYGETILEEVVTFDPLTYTSYMNMNNDFMEVETQGIDGLRVTCAHEFFHVVQLGYQFRNSDIFLMEAAATWMEDVVFDSVNDYLHYLDAIFQQDNVPFDRQGLHQYGMSVWFHFLGKRYGNDIVRSIWEYLRSFTALNACDAALNPFGADLADEIAEFYGWNLLTGSRADTLRFYPEGHLYPEQTLSETVDISQNQVLRRTVRRTGAYYISATPDEETTLVWALVNADWQSGQSQGDAMLQIRWGSAESYFNMITDSVFSALVSDQGYGWRTSVMVDASGDEISLNQYPEFNEMSFASISGHVWIYRESGGSWVQDGGLADVTIGCRGTGRDSLFDTEDDIVFAAQPTDQQGYYEFLGISEGTYRIDLNEQSLTDPYLTFDGCFSREFFVSQGNKVTDADFGVRRLEAWDLPACIPNPYVYGTNTDMKIPFSLEEPAYAELTVFSSQGFLVFQDEGDFPSTGAVYFRWDGCVDGKAVPSGIYMYVIVANQRVLRSDKIAIIH